MVVEKQPSDDLRGVTVETTPGPPRQLSRTWARHLEWLPPESLAWGSLHKHAASDATVSGFASGAVGSPPMKGTLAVTGNAEADHLLNTDPLALVLGMMLDQQVR